MRSRFYVKLTPTANGDFPTDEELRTKIRGFGWELPEIAKLSTDAQKADAYLARATALKERKLIPEVVSLELNATIYFGHILSDQTTFFVTRAGGEMVFRLIHPELPVLVSATKKMLAAVARSNGGKGNRPHNIIDDRISIFEQEHDRIIFEGRLVEHPLVETIKANVKDFLVIIAAFLFVLLTALSHYLSLPVLSTQDLDKAMLSIVALSVVSIIGLGTTFYKIRREKLIAWRGLE
jgi:hypothetical protein